MNEAVWFVAGIALGALGIWLATRRRPSRERPIASTGPAQGAATRAELVSKIGHELKNPIMAIKGLASTGSRLYDSLSDEERRDLFRTIDGEAGRLRLIGEETSTAMKIDAGQLRYDLRADDVGAMVEQVAWRTPVGDHPMAVEADRGLTATVDRTRLSEAVGHLIDNAAKFSPPASTIGVTARAEGTEIVIEVVDGGPGIPADRREAVFERYGAWRPSGYEGTPGAGLGLFIARAHVRAHGGRMEIEEAPAGGTMLRVRVPRGG